MTKIELLEVFGLKFVFLSLKWLYYQIMLIIVDYCLCPDPVQCLILALKSCYEKNWPVPIK